VHRLLDNGASGHQVLVGGAVNQQICLHLGLGAAWADDHSGSNIYIHGPVEFSEQARGRGVDRPSPLPDPQSV
jgi:hypothetical protein